MSFQSPFSLSEPFASDDALQAILETLEEQQHNEDGTVVDLEEWTPFDDRRIMPVRPTPFTWSVVAAASHQAYAEVAAEVGLAPVDDFWRLVRGQPYRRRHPLFDGVMLPSTRGGVLISWPSGNRPDKALETTCRNAVERVKVWYDRVLGTHWGQAELLQVMEEIERIGRALLAADERVRLVRARTTAQILQVRQDAWPDASPEQVACLTQTSLAYDAALQSLHGPAATAVAQLAFLQRYGYRGPLEAELASPRWQEDPAGLARDVPQRGPNLPVYADENRLAVERALVARVGFLRRRGVQALLAARGQAVALCDETDSGRAYWLAGTRLWVLAAAAEATADRRLAGVDDIFYLELEEVKQLMTGEWNITHRESLAELVRRRRVRYAA